MIENGMVMKPFTAFWGCAVCEAELRLQEILILIL
jgi:hypothetical protein